MYRIGFIGTGNMGYAMLKGASKAFSPNISYTDVNEEKLKEIEKEIGISYSLTNQQVVDAADIIVLGIKPQYMQKVLMELEFTNQKILISLAPGITVEKIRSLTFGNPRIVRSMPNTPALIGEGMSSLCFSDNTFSQEERQTVLDLFASFGKVVEILEALMDAVVPVSGSSPAYVFILIEAMADAAVLHGLSREMAYEMAAQSVMGAAKMYLESKTHPAILKDQVCSPGGTTIEAVRVLEEKGFRSAIIEAMDACFEKTKRMQK